jgi:hypothetical protein
LYMPIILNKQADKVKKIMNRLDNLYFLK